MSNLARIFRENVNRLLEDKHISRNELARRTGMHQQAIIKLLNGETEIMTNTMERISIALDVPPDELIREMVAA